MRTSSLLTAALLITSSRILLADAWEYEGHRIAASFDGNSAPEKAYKWPTGDPDDWSAAAASFAIMAKLGLQDKLVHKDQASNKLSLEFLSKVHLRACVVHTDLSRIVQ